MGEAVPKVMGRRANAIDSLATTGMVCRMTKANGNKKSKH